MKNKIFKIEVLLPILIFSVLIFIFVNIWKFFEYQKIQDITLRTELLTEQVATHFEERLETHLEIIKFLRREWLDNNINTPLDFEKVVLPLIKSFPGFQAINYIDTNGVIRWVYPEEPNIEAKDKDLHDHPLAAETFILAGKTGSDCATSAVELWQGGIGIATYFPLIREGRLEGYLNGVFKINDFIRYFFKQDIAQKFCLHFKEDNREFFIVGDENSDHDHRITRDYPVTILNRKWTISLSPKPELIAATTSYINRFFLVFSFILASVFAYLIRLLILRRQKLQDREILFRKLFDSSKDAIMTLNPPSWKFTSGNPTILSMFNVKDIKEFISLGPWDLSPELQPDGQRSDKKAGEMIKIAMDEGSNYFEWVHKKLNGSTFPTTVLLTRVDLESESFLQATVRNIMDQKKEEKLQSVVYQISKAAHSTKSLNALYKSIHLSLKQVLDVANFYIAHYDEKVNLLSFPYSRDAKDNFPVSARPLGKGLTEYIMKTGKPLLLRKKKIEEYTRKGEIEVVGTLPEIWMGSPLKVGTKVIGAVAVNSYDDPDLYTEADLKILTFVSEQIALTIEHKQSITDLEVEKTYLDELFTNSPEAVALVDNESIILDINTEFTSLFGYTEEEIIGKNIDELLTDREQLKNAEKLAHEVSVGRRVFAEATRRKKDGTMVPVSILGSPINYKGGVLAVYAIYRDITDRKQAEDLLKSSEQKHRLLSEQLTEANIMKETLLDVISHDLKNPAGTILGFSELLQEENVDNEIVAGIRSGSKRLIRVIDNVSTLSKITLGEKIELKSLDLVPVIEQVSKEYKSQFTNKDMQLKMNLPDSLQVWANPIIAEVFKNYLSNALKYTADGKQVEIDTAIAEDTVTINFIDHGPTIPKEKREIIFKRGYQLGTEAKRGRGLGLAIVKRIADAHNAEVGVLPNKPKGNVFYLSLPQF